MRSGTGHGGTHFSGRSTPVGAADHGWFITRNRGAPTCTCSHAD
ncbi:hypothetical protein FM114_04215 [Luteococcus japonicus LSP_Lj1]|uniref:Uncharacterized protein n=1 Tax=Luteococcus japonicus LSP_Lj1 TaxID=1255658 RepID=A0A1R4IWW9_9ACTN|nr:hypothetical protein FM114_04215 [Luteococcus japonicus LSP_Lj1]